MFKLNPTVEFERKVTVLFPGEKKQQRGTFDVRFKLIEVDERQRLFEEGGARAVLEEVIVDVSNIEVPEGYDPREVVLNSQPCRGAILAKYNEETEGIERKNSRI